MVLTIPPGVDSDGADLVAWVTALANLTSAPALTELTSAASTKLACFMTGVFEPTADTETNEDKRYCSSDTSETPGKTKWSIGDIEAIADPQSPESESNKAAVAMVEGSSGYFVRRIGKDIDAAPNFAAGDYVEVFSATLGKQVFLPAESGQKVRFRQKVMGVRRISPAGGFKLTA